MVAGEASGDQIAAHLIAALKARGRPMLFAGIGGPKMAAQGFESQFPMEKLSVRGYAEALRHYREIMSIRRRLARAMLAERPDLFIGVDSSDFNLDLERRLKEAGIPTVHYVSPSVWAWRRWRVRRVARSVSHMLVMFPFEAPLYQKAGVPVTYVGHPLADLIPLQPAKAEARSQLRLPARKLIVALLPGSRRSELHYMAAAFVLAAHRFRQEVPDVHFVCPTVTRDTRDMFERAVHEQQRTDLPLTLLFGHSHEALAAADLALVASGTATLEAALFKTPMVIAYRQSPLTWALMRSMLYLPYVGMPNILAGERLVPELLQGEATPAALAAALLALLRDTAAQRRQVERFHEFHHLLRQNTAEKAADAVLSVLERKNS
ncbi:MAG: lipid-A-disaccharide synthase [Betaproteobacteria bacterium RIFCSPLOWO2_12_FULL_68_19]|nr:lipid-A-disaccharide synthase [Betaproteobacteria bacterium]OGA38457.1 MAG: lipid-A-disaccharide synthase [Betaproteobacteria bacterium RIFCSPLOWO2_12_FULL_68_19]